MGQVIIDRVDCASIVGRYYVDLRAEPSSVSPIKVGVDGGPLQVMGTSVGRETSPNTSYFTVPNPAPKDGQSHTLLVQGAAGAPSSRASAPCSPSAAVVAASMPAATPAAPSAAPITVGGGPASVLTGGKPPTMIKAGLGAGGLAAVALAVWYFFLRKRR